MELQAQAVMIRSRGLAFRRLGVELCHVVLGLLVERPLRYSARLDSSTEHQESKEVEAT